MKFAFLIFDSMRAHNKKQPSAYKMDGRSSPFIIQSLSNDTEQFFELVHMELVQLKENE